MAPPPKARFGCDGGRKWRTATGPSLKRTGVSTAAPSLPPPHWHARPSHRPGQIPHLPLFHGRHAEESAERPHLVTVVRPGHSAPRKVTVLLNRRGVVSFEQLLLDVSEALGFPRWHRSRVTRLYTAFAREVKSVSDFFRSDTALLALGKARPELSSLKEALEELFPEQSRYRSEALLVWEKKLRPAPDKAAKADSGYVEGPDRKDGPLPKMEKPIKGFARKDAQLPNHLQKLRMRGVIYEEIRPAIGRFQRERVMDSFPLCENCLARRTKHPSHEWIKPLSGRAPLPPLCRKQIDESLQAHPGISSDYSMFASEDSEVSEADVERLYDVGRLLGDGNFAVVRECRRRTDGKTLAVKMVERSRLLGREHMLQNELSLLVSLKHPRVIRLLAHHLTPARAYLVMELAGGGDLFEAISDRGSFEQDEAALMVADVSAALKYIHRRSVVHRDVKPENLLIVHTVPGLIRLKLADFGLAMVVTEPVFTICGTPTYVAPEILSETGYGVEVDMWALGVIFYILLCGFAPFRSQDRDQEELFEIIKQGELHFQPPYWDVISDEAKRLVSDLLQPDPVVRMTAEQMLQHPWLRAMAASCQQKALECHRQSRTQKQPPAPAPLRRESMTAEPETVGASSQGQASDS
ncbi:serine/threonine-protein kinase DCLK3 [Corythoichthys intestinalis]|uniref:serine/threonine-protein kinase DCLK3 n=1 Tax=Corythoichthys intestinalis TaxID=161448 RepID=UPI0025A68021|nr:serine/threonine-protein kinase DCLK3 [Corythoichthys intestinalis]XP_061808797.1 serine/threonine-protein kinase DCLK3-like [Nerophis lumbriciformis]